MAAQAGTISMVGVSGRTYQIDVYIPDAVATYLTFNATGLAASTSSATLIVPEDGYINDVSGAAPTAVGFNIQLDSAAQPGYTLRWSNQLATLANRMKLILPVKKGQQLQALQF